MFIFDEAQMTYDDLELWGAIFKSVHDFKSRRVVIFASYGSPTARISTMGGPFIVPDCQRITLHHIGHEDGFHPVGLLFTPSEFNDLIVKRYPSSEFCFHSSFFNDLFNIINGHIGAICDFICHEQ